MAIFWERDVQSVGRKACSICKMSISGLVDFLLLLLLLNQRLICLETMLNSYKILDF